MTDGTLPPVPPTPPVYPAPIPPQPGTTGLGKSHIGLILGAVGLFLIFRMMSGSSSSSGTAGSSDNPLIGSWSLEATEDKSYCGTNEVFKTDSMSEVKNGVTTSYATTYLIKPNYVDVALNGDLAHYGEWDETAPDEITFRINSLYVAASCKYHRD